MKRLADGGAPDAHNAEGTHTESKPTKPATPKSTSARPTHDETVEQAREFLETLGYRPDDRIAVCYATRAGDKLLPILTTVAEAPGIIARHRDGNVWASVCPVRRDLTAGRGKTADVVGIRNLWADLDFDRFPGTLEEQRAAVEAVLADLVDILGAQPAAVAPTGHGIQPRWIFDPEDHLDFEPGSERSAEVAALVKRWGRLVNVVAQRHGGSADSVFDLARVMRVPGTVNRKVGLDPVPVTVDYPGGAAITLDGLADVLDAYGIPDEPRHREASEPATAYTGPAYTEMPESVRRRVYGHVDSVFERIGRDLTEGAALPEGKKNARRDGWQKILSNAAWQAGAWIAPWSGLTREQALERLREMTPQAMATAAYSGGQTFESILDAQIDRKAKEPAPAWLDDAIAEARAAERFESGPATASRAGEAVAEAATEATKAPTTPEPLAPSWAPVPLAEILSGKHRTPAPSIMPRNDERHLVYAGLVHSFHGESESGKSLLVQSVAAQQIKDGHGVVYIDFESDAPSVVGRMRAMGCTVGQIAAHLLYIRPEASPTATTAELAAFEDLLTQRPALIVLDGVTDALGLMGLTSKDNDEAARWFREVPRRIARETGAAVIVIDHVTKNADSRGRFAIGGQAKMAAIDGAAYVVDVVEPLGAGKRGRLSVRIAKDRPGGVRGHCGAFRSSDRTQEAASVIVDSTGGGIAVDVRAPQFADEATVERHKAERAAGLMRAIIDEVTVHPGATTNAITKAVAGRSEAIGAALRELIADGYLTTKAGARNSTEHYLGPRRFAIGPDLLPTAVKASSDRFPGVVNE